MITRVEIDNYLSFIESRGLSYTEFDCLKLIVDPDELFDYCSISGNKIGIIYSSPYNTLLVDLVEDSYGNRCLYERIVKTNTGNSVVVIAVKDGKCVLLKHFRHAVGKSLLEFPRGHGEPGLSIEENTKKEVAEELNTVAKNIELIGKVIADTGLCGEEVNVVCCEIEDISVDGVYEGIKDYYLYSLDELMKLISSGEIIDSFTVASVLYFAKLKGVLK